MNEFASFLKQNNLNQKDYPIHLRHNDYEGLEYKEIGKNKYIAYVKIEA